MSDLIERTRELIGDPAGADEEFSGQAVQNAIDRTRIRAHYTALTPDPTRSAGVVSYLAYYADYGDWESDVQLVDMSYNTLTPSTSDYQEGRWTFATSTSPSVYLVGKTYDIYGAAADLLEQWAGRLADQFDVTVEGEGSYKRSQTPQRLEAQAGLYKSRMRPLMGFMGRLDAL